MPPKTKITLTNSLKYQFNHFLRTYQQALATTNSPEVLQPINILNIFDNLGFVSEQKLEKDYELVNTIAYLLSFPHKQASISPRNLFKFLANLTDIYGQIDSFFQQNVQPLPKDHQQLQQPLVKVSLGSFSAEGSWQIPECEINKLKQIFGHMIFTRASRVHKGAAKKTYNQDQEQYNPKILRKSIFLAQHRNQRLGTEGPVQVRLMQGKINTENRIKQEKQMQYQKLLKQCSFKPKINSLSISLKNENEQNLSRDELLLKKGRQYEFKKKMYRIQKQQSHQKFNRSYCSFKPDLSLSRASLRHSIKRQRINTVKNEEKVVNRVRIASQQRQHLNQVYKRGYPTGISWVNYMEEVKNKRIAGHHNSVCQTLPSITFDLKNINNSLNFKIKNGERLSQLASNICKEYQISESHKDPIVKMLKASINNSNSASIKNGKVCINS